MFEHWKELLAAAGVAGAGAAGGIYATTQTNASTIEIVREDVQYLRERVDFIIDRLPQRRLPDE